MLLHLLPVKPDVHVADGEDTEGFGVIWGGLELGFVVDDVVACVGELFIVILLLISVRRSNAGAVVEIELLGATTEKDIRASPVLEKLLAFVRCCKDRHILTVQV